MTRTGRSDIWLPIQEGGSAADKVLISHYALDPANKGSKVIPVDLTKAQIEQSPSLATDRPVSRQYEGDYYSYYGWPGYWGGPCTSSEKPVAPNGAKNRTENASAMIECIALNVKTPSKMESG